jgi:glycosyltransferase involved in cell wall biosynthesis
MRIMVSTPMIGGVGGVERAVASWLDALSGHDLYVCPSRRIRGGFEIDSGVRVVHPLKYVGSRNRHERVARALLRLVPPPRTFDLYLQFRGGPSLLGHIECVTSAFSPAGKPAFDYESSFDVVLAQAPDGVNLVHDRTKLALIPPPITLASLQPEAVSGVPSEFYLTVFNPHDPAVKGLDLLYRSAGAARFPIVWCRDDTTRDFAGASEPHPNIIPMSGLRPGQLRYLYERCAAYVCFSRTEGFGWAIADALLHQRPVISRRIGVLTWLPDDGDVDCYVTDEELAGLLAAGPAGSPSYDLSMLDARRSAEALLDLVRAAPARRYR